MDFLSHIPMIIAAVLVLIAGPVLIPWLHKLKFGQSIRELGPQSHQIKSGTPTMGGLMLIPAIAIASLFAGPVTPRLWLALFIMLGHFAIGFLDDYLKVVHKENTGLKKMPKFLSQVFMAVLVTYLGIEYLHIPTTLWLPGENITIELGTWYYVLVFFVLVGTTNAVNLTDGLDGLAAGCVALSAFYYAFICTAVLGAGTELAAFAKATTGACLGFLYFNRHPAKVFMGDTGSLALGGVMAALAILSHTELLLVVVGFVYVLEAVSVIIQVAVFRSTGKKVRFFRMAPLHHHFELKGWSEIRVVRTFWLVSAISGTVGMLLLQLNK